MICRGRKKLILGMTNITSIQLIKSVFLNILVLSKNMKYSPHKSGDISFQGRSMGEIMARVKKKLAVVLYRQRNILPVEVEAIFSRIPAMQSPISLTQF